MPPTARADRNGESEHAPLMPGEGEPSPDEAALPHRLAVPVHLNQAFRVLWLARTLGQMVAQTAQLGSLLIIVEATDGICVFAGECRLLLFAWSWSHWGRPDPWPWLRDALLTRRMA